MNTEERIKLLLDNPATPFWVRDLVLASLDRDPVDVASHLEFLAQLFAQRADDILTETQQMLNEKQHPRFMPEFDKHGPF